jgi:hypothetical protein
MPVDRGRELCGGDTGAATEAGDGEAGGTVGSFMEGIRIPGFVFLLLRLQILEHFAQRHQSLPADVLDAKRP